jgi:hypothetical protein
MPEQAGVRTNRELSICPDLLYSGITHRASVTHQAQRNIGCDSQRAMRNAALISSLLLALTSCDLPRDASGTLKRVQHGTMKVGVIVDTPWVTMSKDSVGGVEAQLAQELARRVDAHIQWVQWPAADLLDSLHARKIDLLIGGLVASSPWSQQVAFTRPYFTDTTKQKHVLAVAPGENAWQVKVEELLHEREKGIGPTAGVQHQ